MTNTVSYKGSLINYFRFANGDKILFCFHGYGENAETFLFLEKYLEKKYTLIAIDFPLHGKTVWGNDEIFLPDDLINIIELINPEPEKKFSVLAYSMGGRIALHLLQTIPESIENIGLVAPDGLHLNFWYWLGTQTKTGNRLFKITTKNPAWIFWLMNMIDKTGLLNKSLVNFSRKFLEDKQERIMLYKRWTMMKKFKPTHAGIKKSMKQWPGKLSILFGKHDRVILSKRSRFLSVEKNVEIKIIDAGHNLLKERYADEIMRLLS